MAPSLGQIRNYFHTTHTKRHRHTNQPTNQPTSTIYSVGEQKRHECCVLFVARKREREREFIHDWERASCKQYRCQSDQVISRNSKQNKHRVFLSMCEGMSESSFIQIASTARHYNIVAVICSVPDVDDDDPIQSRLK